jgi:hypothetical protein
MRRALLSATIMAAMTFAAWAEMIDHRDRQAVQQVDVRVA